ncbi:MAG: DUF3006 domain-containing protein [Clostridia bacterium]|nr:DUF3006 domain-containing protein [Clostridia bacterium]
MKLTVDRIEEGFAVCELEDGSNKNIALTELPAETQEGTVLQYVNGEYSINSLEQDERSAKLFALQNSIFDE